MKDTRKQQIENLAIQLHNNYEVFSQEEKWKSQDLCRGKPFGQLPLRNQKVMLRMAETVLNRIEKVKQEILREIFAKFDGWKDWEQIRDKDGVLKYFKVYYDDYLNLKEILTKAKFK